MKLKKVYIGKTQKLDIRGQEISTAYLRTPVTGKVKVSSQGLEGNEVAVHTDAVYAISEENYDYWSNQLGADTCDWSSGVFAENLLISGLNEKEVQVGDVLAIGDYVRLSVSGPRVPCSKLTWRLNQPDTFLNEFALSGRSGIYFNVEQTGVIKAGDKVSWISSAKESVRIIDIINLIYSSSVNTSLLEKVISLPGLSETSALILRNRYYQALDQKRISQYRWDGWRDVKVTKVVDETAEIKSFYLSPLDNNPLTPFLAGQFIAVKMPTNEQTTIRVWSLSDYQDMPNHYRISIKREHNGVGSGYMHQTVNEGDILSIKTPMGHFSIDRSSFRPTLMIAGGIGITPLLAMLKAQLERGDNMPPMYFIYCCQNRQSQAFRQQLDLMVQKHKFNILHVYSNPNANDKCGDDYDLKGYLKGEHIKAFIAGCNIYHGDKKVYMPLSDFDIYMCGPSVFQDTVHATLLSLGANMTRIKTEPFGPAALDSSMGCIERSEVTFTKSNKTVMWTATSGKTLLDLAESEGLTPSHSCRIGVCQACSVKITDGKVMYGSNIACSPEAGQILLCSAKPASKRVVLDM